MCNKIYLLLREEGLKALVGTAVRVRTTAIKIKVRVIKSAHREVERGVANLKRKKHSSLSSSKISISIPSQKDRFEKSKLFRKPRILRCATKRISCCGKGENDD